MGLLCYFSSMVKPQSAKNKKNRKRRILIRISWAVLFILVIVFLISLPAIVESYTLSRLKKAGFVNPRLNIRSLGFNKVDVNSLTLGDPGKPDLTIPSIAVDFSLPGLLKGKMKKIEVSGMTLSIDVGEKGVILQGFKSSPSSGDGSGQVSLPVDEIKINSALLHLSWQDKRVKIPFDFSASRVKKKGDQGGKKEDSFSFSGAFFPYGEDISVKGSLDISSGTGPIFMETDSTKLHRFVEDFPGTLPFFFRSTGKVKSTIFLNSWHIEKWQVSLGSEAVEIALPGGKLSCDLGLDFKMGPELIPTDIFLKVRFASVNNREIQVAIPFDLQVSGENIDTLNFNITDLRLKEPAGMIIKNLSGKISGLPGKLIMNGSFSCEAVHELIPEFVPWINAKGISSAAGDFLVDLSGEKGKWEIKGKGSGNLRLFSADVNMRLNHLAMLFSVSSSGEEIVSDINLTARDSQLLYDSYEIHAKKLISQKKVRSSSNDLKVSGNLKVLSAKIAAQDGLQAEGLNLDFPYCFPYSQTKILNGKEPKDIKEGSFKIKRLQITDLDVGEISGNIIQSKAGLNFSGLIHTPVKELQAEISGDFKVVGSAADALLKFQVRKTNISEDAQFGALHPFLAGFKISGFISGAGELSLKEGLFNSSARLKLEDVELKDGTGSFKCSGINTEIKMKDMIGLASEFSQELSFNSLYFGGLALNEGKVIFGIEDSETVFIEKGEFTFCDGRVLVNPFRFETGKDDFKITLFCDRIDFDKMVNILMGKQIAFGDAELNGILPVRILKGNPVFSDGYLYSTPGVGGNLKFAESKVISGGVLLVEEAMKDFNYDWIKLRLNTVKEKLDMVVLVNGTPAGKLPLTYDSKSKDIVRDKKGKRRINLKGLLLELRFKDIDLKGLLQDGAKILSVKKKHP